MRIKIYPYKMSSTSAKKLARALGALKVTEHTQNKFIKNRLIINWGNSTTPAWYQILNTVNLPSSVAIAANKRKTFDSFLLAGVNHPDWTDDTECAQSWIDEGHKIYGRKSLTSHSGQGIRIFDSETICTSMECPLYVKAVKKDKEYRVHVAGGNIIDFQQKKKREGFDGGISGIRNHSNGWVYARENVTLPEEVKNQSIKAVEALGLDFGAVDICTSLNGNVYVFEVNTAPGLEGTTLNKYIQYFKGL